MKFASAVLSLSALAFAGAVSAGKGGAGPAATASPGVGSVVTPGSGAILGTLAKDEDGNLLLPGNSGTVLLTGTQLAQAAAVLTAAEGAVVAGPVIKAPTMLADGGAATMVLNTETGQLTIVRNE